VAHAQSTDASVSGRVTDQSNLVMPDVEVEIKNVDTGLAYATKTNSDGFYSFPNLPPGNYVMSVHRLQFRSVSVTGITLHVQDSLSRNFVLQVGSSDVSITVTADQNNINTTDATVSTTIDRNFAENLPLNGRSFQTLILLTPGTAIVSVGANGGTFSVNGQRTNANSFTVDGVSANLGGTLYQNSLGQFNGANPGFTAAGSTQGMVSVDALQEFKIQTSTYAPEFGRQPGGQISLLTRSGANDFHGTAFDYLRNNDLDANNWFNDQQGLPKGAERQNDFGGTLGGPIFKDKTFFFFSYEGLRLLQPHTNTQTVPSLRFRQESTAAYQQILNSWPIPDGREFTTPCNPMTDPTCPASGQKPTGGAPYTYSQSLPTNLDSSSIKIDHTFRERLHVFGRYSDTTSSATSLLDSNLFDQKTRSRVLTLGTDVSIRANLQNELRLNYSVNASTPFYLLDLIGGAKAFDKSILYPSPLVSSSLASFRINLPNLFLSTSPGPSGKFSQRQASAIDNVSQSVGSHQLKWGVDYRRLFPIYAQPPLKVGYVVFSENDLINGNIANAETASQLVAHPIYTNFSLYGQDTWRVSNRLALTYGLRWELNPPPGERDGIQPLNIIGLNNPATATLAPLNSKLYKTSYDNFAPRIGMAYQLRQGPGRATVIRGGFGMFYDLDSEATALGFDTIPFQSFIDKSNVPFPVGSNALQVPPLPAPLSPPYIGMFAVDPHLKLPYSLQWNVSIEQELGQSQSLSASYVASAGYDLLRSDFLSELNPNFLYLQAVRNASNSIYQSLQLQFNRRLSRGLQALASYTYSHSIDDSSDGQAFFLEAQGDTFPNPRLDRGNSSFDLRHAFRGALTYNIPTRSANLFSKAVLGGWSVDTIALAQTGLPVDLIGGTYFFPPLFGGVQLRPNVVPGIPLYLSGAQCTVAFGGQPCPGSRAFNPAAFTPVPQDANGAPTQVQGTFGRNVLRGFGGWQIDFALHRQFNLTERVNLQFRSEFFNIFNHPNFAGVDNMVGDGLFGQARSTLNNSLGGVNPLYQIGGPRSIQLALKLSF
jgi:Carboxypeptidase regulatory-like domain/TonB dependent receptor